MRRGSDISNEWEIPKSMNKITKISLVKKNLLLSKMFHYYKNLVYKICKFEFRKICM